MRFRATNACVALTAMPFEQRAPKYVSSYLIEISDTCLAFGAKTYCTLKFVVILLV